MIRYVCLLILVTFNLCVSAQESGGSSKEQLAAQFYQNGEFDKAADLYEELFNKTGNQLHLNSYISSLIALKDFKTGEKVLKKQIKRQPSNLSLLVELGLLYKASGESSRADKEFKNAIDKVPADQQSVLNLAATFINKKEPDYAIETYQKGKKLLKGIYPFNYELAEAYAQKGNYAEMINEYLEMLELSDAYLQTVQNALQAKLADQGGDVKSDLLRNQLLKKVQSDPGKTIFSEMLIWLSIQQKDFEAAFFQAKALDKRMKQDGARIMNLGALAFSNKDYSAAAKCYEYVITKGPSNYFYATAKMELLNVLNSKITNEYAGNKQDLISLKVNYESTISELGKSAATASLLKGYAHLLAFYLHETDKALLVLDEIMKLPQVTPKILAECKLEMGDILLMTGERWEATLLYSQVEKAFHNDVLGQEAKFRNARLSYFVGDFQWAQAQLDVLKAATSKLIANDALDLSLLITDNTGLDSNLVPLTRYAKADLMIYQNKDSMAIMVLDSLLEEYRHHSIADEVVYKKAVVMFKQSKYNEAARYFKEVMETYPADVLGDDAMFNLAKLQEEQLKNKEKAKELYQELLVRYPGSLYTVEARKRFRTLRGDILN